MLLFLEVNLLNAESAHHSISSSTPEETPGPDRGRVGSKTQVAAGYSGCLTF